MSRRLFTPAQANRTLPLVRRIVADVLACGREARRLLRGGADEDAEAVVAVQGRIRTLIGELEELGCQYKGWGFDVGLVDFPGKIRGERVLLCWRSDESAVTYYHRYEDGFRGRRPIPRDLLEEQFADPSDAIV